MKCSTLTPLREAGLVECRRRARRVDAATAEIVHAVRRDRAERSGGDEAPPRRPAFAERVDDGLRQAEGISTALFGSPEAAEGIASVGKKQAPRRPGRPSRQGPAAPRRAEGRKFFFFCSDGLKRPRGSGCRSSSCSGARAGSRVSPSMSTFGMSRSSHLGNHQFAFP